MSNTVDAFCERLVSLRKGLIRLESDWESVGDEASFEHLDMYEEFVLLVKQFGDEMELDCEQYDGDDCPACETNCT